MNPKFCIGKNYVKNSTLDELKKEYDSIKNDIYTIQHMKISEQAKELPLEELKEQLEEIKEKMHDAIDALD